MNNKTKKYRGGNNKLLDDSFVINNLKEFLNERPLKYKFDIKKNTHYGKSTFDVFIQNSDQVTNDYNPNNEPCLSIILYTTNQGVSIAINTLNKCIPINNYGNFMLNSIKDFAYKYGYYSVIITSDGSTLDFKFNEDGNIKHVYLDLSILSILSTGESWYNKLGFYTPINTEQIQDNTFKIRQDIGDIDEPSKIIEYINNSLKPYEKRINRIPPCFKLVNTYRKFGELYNFILDLTKKTDKNSIQEVFQEITNIIKNNCDTNTNTCRISYDTLFKIDCFIMFLYNLLDIKYKATSLIYIVPKNEDNMSEVGTGNKSGGKSFISLKKKKKKRNTKKKSKIYTSGHLKRH